MFFAVTLQRGIVLIEMDIFLKDKKLSNILLDPYKCFLIPQPLSSSELHGIIHMLFYLQPSFNHLSVLYQLTRGPWVLFSHHDFGNFQRDKLSGSD